MKQLDVDGTRRMEVSILGFGSTSGQRVGRGFIRRYGLVHGAEKDANEPGEPTNASQSLSCR